MKVEVNIPLLNVRKEASMEAGVLRVASQGERLTVVSQTDEWVCVQADIQGAYGFVVAEYVTEIE